MSAFKKHQTAAANAVAEMIPKVIERIRSRDTVVELMPFAQKEYTKSSVKFGRGCAAK